MKRLIQNRRSAGWNLIEIIVAVAIGASIAAAGVAAYQGEAQKAAVAKAKDFIAQVETKKAQIVTDIASGDTTATTALSYLAGQIKVQGAALSGDPSADAAKLGFKALDYGNMDTQNTDGSVTSETHSAWVQLANSSVVYQNTVLSAAPY
ncbi:MAG: prepilin-type N-terminal cleavage/methylation domain-containing protein [Verrucomicrobia bacterium]|nr:prepilin-type N-terminal cleavage/methylation domain-containing protein [Verrucomicrobiota bacterium]